MIITIPRIVQRSFVLKHPEIIFLYGHDVMDKGFFGHSEIAHENNTYPIHTLYKFCNSGARYFDDNDSAIEGILKADFAAVPVDGRPVVALRRMGCGCSRMKELAPRYYNEMWNVLQRINVDNIGMGFDIVWDYKAN
jgi:hypothetical protein